jgi:hypothetical protein
MTNLEPVVSDFYFFCKMAGIKQVKHNIYAFNDRKYRVNLKMPRSYSQFLGGARHGYKMARHAMMVAEISKNPDNAHIAGLVSASLGALIQKYPQIKRYC